MSINLDAEFPIRRHSTYLNTAAQGPWPARTVEAVTAAARAAQLLAPDSGSGENAILTRTRARLAALLNAQPEDFVFTPHTTHGLNTCVHGIDWREGDNIVVPRAEFPSVQLALAHLPARGVEVRAVQPVGIGTTADELFARVDGRTRAVICSAITWDTGFRADLETLGARCERAGCLLIVDGIHAVGAQPLDLPALRVSALAFHSYKWLLAGFGNGVLYVSPKALDRIAPTFLGPLAMQENSADARTFAPGAQRYAGGNANQTGAVALHSSLTLLEEFGLANIAAHNLALADAIESGIRRALPEARVLRAKEPTHRSAIVVFTTGSGDAAMVEHLTTNNVIVALRPAGIRVAPHLFNTMDDVERFVRCLK